MAIHALYECEPDLYLDELCTFLAVEHNLIVSKSTLSRNLAQAGLTYKILHKIAIEHDKQLRDEWKKSLSDWTKFQGDRSKLYVLMRPARMKRH